MDHLKIALNIITLITMHVTCKRQPWQCKNHFIPSNLVLNSIVVIFYINVSPLDFETLISRSCREWSVLAPLEKTLARYAVYICTATKIPIMYFQEGIAWPQSQFPHLCVCEGFKYCQDRSTYFSAVAAEGRLIVGIYKSWDWSNSFSWNNFFKFLILCLCSVISSSNNLLYIEYTWRALFTTLFQTWHRSVIQDSNNWIVTSFYEVNVVDLYCGTQSINLEITCPRSRYLD